jgi:hypothetical protein
LTKFEFGKLYKVARASSTKTQHSEVFHREATTSYPFSSLLPLKTSKNACDGSSKRKQGEGHQLHDYGSWYVAVGFKWFVCMAYFRFLGAAGTGRTTFVNTLCDSEVLSHKVYDNPETANVEEQLTIKSHTVGESFMFCPAFLFSQLIFFFLQSSRKKATVSP